MGITFLAATVHPILHNSRIIYQRHSLACAYQTYLYMYDSRLYPRQLGDSDENSVGLNFGLVQYEETF